jgi:hypothetical protein
MPESDSESSPLDHEDWEIAFEPYKGQPLAALTLGFHLTELKRRINGLEMREALAAIDRAVDVLFEYSQFRDVSHELFLIAVEGRLTTEKEELLRQLGIRV